MSIFCTNECFIFISSFLSFRAVSFLRSQHNARTVTKEAQRHKKTDGPFGPSDPDCRQSTHRRCERTFYGYFV